MNRRWVVAIVGLVSAALIVFVLSRPRGERSGTAMPATDNAGVNGPASAVPAPARVASVNGTQPAPRVAERVLPTNAPPAALPSQPVAPIDPAAPREQAIEGLAQRLCARATASDTAGVTALLGPGWRGHVPLDELRSQCAGNPTTGMAAGGDYGTASSIFGESAVRHWAERSGLDAENCVGLRLGNSRAMACRDTDGQYRIATVAFSAGPPPDASTGPVPRIDAPPRPADANYDPVPANALPPPGDPSATPPAASMPATQ